MAKKKVFQISDALAEGLEETINAAQLYSGELRVDVIPLKRIEVDPENPRDLLLSAQDLYQGLSEEDSHYARKTAELTSLQTIAYSIRDQGIINPIVVYKYGDKYRLVAGERRTLASILAGKQEIQAKILDTKPSPLKISLLQWIENVERSDLSLWERLRNLEKIVAAYAKNKGMMAEQITITELSNLIGCTKPHAINYKAVLTADESLKQLIRANKIKNLEKAALLASIEVPALKQQAIHACLTGTPLKKLKLLVKQNHVKVNPDLRQITVRTRGRQSTAVNFGMTKNLNVAKAILESLRKDHSLSYLANVFANVNWHDYKSVTNTFKRLIKKLEEMHI